MARSSQYDFLHSRKRKRWNEYGLKREHTYVYLFLPICDRKEKGII